MDDHLLGWLRTLDEDRLGRILANRPDAIAAPWPRRLDTLAQRLSNGFAVMEALRRPAAALPGAGPGLPGHPRGDRRRLAGFLGAPAEELRPWLDLPLRPRAAWPAGEGHDPPGRGRLPVVDRAARPGRAARPLPQLLDHQRRHAARPGPQPRPAPAHQQAPHGHPGDRGRSATPPADGAAGAAPPTGHEAAAGRLRLGGPRTRRRRRPGSSCPARRRSGRPTTACSTGRAGTWPRCPGRWRSPARPRLPPAVHPPAARGGHHPGRPRRGRPPDDAGRAARRGALRGPAGQHLQAPLPLLKAGGVGVREVRRVAKETGCDEDETRLLLEICAVARLLAWDEPSGGMVPTERFDRWRLDEGRPGCGCCCRPGGAWSARRCARSDGKYGTVLGDDPAGRHRRPHPAGGALASCSHLPAGTAFADRAGLVGQRALARPAARPRPAGRVRLSGDRRGAAARAAGQRRAHRPRPGAGGAVRPGRWRERRSRAAGGARSRCWWRPRRGRWPASAGVPCSART